MSLLPPNRTALERAIADATAVTLDPAPLRTIADSVRCPASLLPWLAWARSVEGFDAASTESQQRELIRQSIAIRRKKGTIAAVREVFRAVGFGDVEIDQGNNQYRADGSQLADGFCTAGDPNGWAEYRVHVDKLLSVAQANAAKSILDNVAPRRCTLWGIDFVNATLIANGEAFANGEYTAGVIA